LTSGDGRFDISRGSIYFIGMATVLIRHVGFTILTDPNFLHQREYARLGYGLRSRRLTNPDLSFQQLPPYDLVLLSHLHEDHFDRRVENYSPLAPRLPRPTMQLHRSPRRDSGAAWDLRRGRSSPLPAGA